MIKIRYSPRLLFICATEYVKNMRADLYLFKYGYTESRQKAQNHIACGSVTIDGKLIKTPSTQIDENSDHIVLLEVTDKYVSRGGIKLETALNTFEIDVSGAACIDIGASTGGFTDCLLQHGALSVIAVDAGHGQLHKKLLEDQRVTSFEGINARELSLELLNGIDSRTVSEPDIAVMDVSFISQTMIIPNIAKLLKPGGGFITLIKPQFEAGREALDKKGIVKKAEYRCRAINLVLHCAFEAGFALYGITRSAIAGGDGNIEYLAYFRLTDDKSQINTTVRGGYPFGMITPGLESIISNIV